MENKVLSFYKKLKKVFSEVYEDPFYVFWGFFFAFLFVAVVTWIPNISLYANLLFSGSISIFDSTKIIFFSLDDFFSFFSLVDQIFILISSMLVGLNFSLMIFFIRKRSLLLAQTGSSFLGVIVGVLGVGCSSCGSVVLTTFLGASASANLVHYFPLRGLEFSILSIGILLVSTYFLVQKMSNPLVCKN